MRAWIRRICRSALPLTLLVGVLVVAAPLPASASDPLTFVGTIGFPRLGSPEGVAVASNGDVYVTDRNAIGTLPNDRLVKFDADGHLVDVLAGPEPLSGNIPTGVVADPSGIAVAPSGAVYVLEKYSNSDNRVQEFDSLGNFVTWWGGYTPGASPPATEQKGSLGSGNGEFAHPQAIAVDPLGNNVYVADTGNKRVQAFTSAGGWTASWCSDGAVPVLGSCPSPQPTGIAVDSSDVVYVAAGGVVRRFDTSGNLLSSWSVPGATGVAIDGSDNVWVANGNAVKEYDNLGATLIGTYGSGVLTGGAVAISVAPSGKVYVADNGNTANTGGKGFIQRFASDGTTEIEWGEYPGAGVPDFPSGLAVDAVDNVYITKKVTDQIQKFDENGNLLDEFGGTGNAAGFLNDPAALAVSSDGYVYVADTGNQRIQKFDTSGNFVTQWGSAGTNDGQVADPAGIAVDGSGQHVYVSDTSNNRIQEFSSNGVFIRKWGVFGTADGNLKAPKGLWIDGSGNVWVADSGSNNRIQEFSGVGTFLAKLGATGSGNGQLKGPSDVAIDHDGTLWVVDQSNNRIERFTTGGTYLSQLGTKGLETSQFNSPIGIDVDSTGRILVTDSANHRVEVFKDLNGPDTTISGPALFTPSSSASFTFTANEQGATFQCKLDGGSYGSCTSPKTYNSLVQGSHTFYAQATDSHGFLGNQTTYAWTIDTTPPIASLTGYPASPTSSTSAQFTFISNEANSTFLCAKDSTTYTSCSSPKSYSSLGSGSHVFHVKAIDPAGNTQTTSTNYTWMIDTTPPNVSIDSGPSGWVQSTDATFKFSSTDGAATFDCKLDGGSYAPCTSPTGYTGLVAGQHSFYVTATDAIGNTSAPAHHTWTADTQTHRPDNQIATGTTYVGNDIYNATGTNQTKTLKAGVGKTVTFKIRIENDGSGTDPLTILGTGSGKGYSVTYFSGATNITSRVVAGTYKINLDPAASVLLKMTVKVGSTASTSRSILVKTSADHEPTRLDAVKAVVKRV
jgi:DNA-binding beta-propeller fold protein YncE